MCHNTHKALTGLVSFVLGHGMFNTLLAGYLGGRGRPLPWPSWSR
ncbi:hypothetical protein [Aeromonas sp. S16(2024)]